MNISSPSWFIAAKSRLSAIQSNIHCIVEQHKYNIMGGGNGCHLIIKIIVSTHTQRMKNTPAMNFQMTRRSQCVFSSGAPLRFSLNAMRHICRPDSSRQGMQKSRLKNSSNGHNSSKMSVTVKILGSLTNAESISCINLDFLINGTYFLPPE